MSASELTVEALLRAHAPQAPESLRARVLANEPTRHASRRRALLLAAAAASLAVGAAVVHGVIGSGSSQKSVTLAGEARTTPTWESAGGQAQKRLLPATADRTSAAGIAGSSSRLQHTDASLQLRVSSDDTLASATTRATRIASSLGGYAQSVHYASHGSSVIDLRIPTQNVQRALARLTALGTLVSQRISITDLEQRLQTQSAQIAQLRRRIAALQNALRDSSLPDAQRVILQIRLSESKRALAQRLHARTGTVTSGTMAHVAVQIGTKRSIAPVHHRGRIGRIVHSAVGFLALEAIVVLFALIVASPIALVLGLAWLWRRRSVDRLLTSHS
jgi:hypothetical protein